MPDREKQEVVRNISASRLAVAVVLLLLPVASGGAIPLLQFFVPAAVMALMADYHRAAHVVIAVSGIGVLLAMISGQPAAMPLVLENGGVALILLNAERHGQSAPGTALACTFFLVSAVIAALTIMSGVGFYEAMNAITSELSGFLEKSMEEYRAAGTLASPDAELWFAQMQQTVVSFFPGIVGCSLAGAGIGNVMLARHWIKRHYDRDVLGPDFASWQFPDWLIWGFIVAAVCAVSGHEVLELPGQNALLVICFIYMIQGAALIQYYFKVSGAPAYIRWLTWFVLGMQFYGIVMVTVFGIASTWIDIRKFVDGRFRKDSNIFSEDE